MQERLFTAYQIADLLDATPGVVAGWIQDGRLTSHRLPGGAIRIAEQDLVKFLRTEGIDIKQILADTVAKEKAQAQAQASAQESQYVPSAAVEPAAVSASAVSESEKAALQISADESSIMEVLLDDELPQTPMVDAIKAPSEPQPQAEITPAPAPEPEPEPEPQPEPAPAAKIKAQPEPEPQEDAPSAKTASKLEQLADEIVRGALHHGTAAVHIETDDKAISVRLRLHGSLQEDTHFKKHKPRTLGPELIEHFISLAGLDCDFAGPQSGQFEITLDDKTTTIGISAVRTMRGRKIVLRPADSAAQIKLADLDISTEQSRAIGNLLSREYGLILLVAPPRNQATQTLAAMAGHLSADPRRSVMLLARAGGDQNPIEDASCCACSSMSATTMLWSGGMAAGLEQDADVIAIEDIVDPATAQAAIEASASAVVIGIMRSTSVAAAMAMLARMGAEPWMLASVLTGVIEQRSVRTLCDECKKAADAKPAALAAIGLDRDEVDFTVYAAGRCAKCGQSGYLGRSTLLTLATIDTDHGEKLADAIRNASGEQAISEALTAQRPALLTGGLELLKAGETTLEELNRAELD